jgi:type VI secretion system protein ImpA
VSETQRWAESDVEASASSTSLPPLDRIGAASPPAVSLIIEPLGLNPLDSGSSGLEPEVAALLIPLSSSDPCGPDLDLEGDGPYLNFFAAAEGILPSSYFSTEDGKPFDRSTVDLRGQIEAIEPLWKRSRDLRLLIVRARLLILNRDLGGFATTLAAVAEWLENFWDAVHPRAPDGNAGARVAAISGLEMSTVTFPLQYSPLFEARRIGTVTYRSWLIASGEVNPRSGELKHPTSSISEARSDADPEVLATTRRHISLIKTSVSRIRAAFQARKSSAGLEPLAILVDKMLAFVDPYSAAGQGPAIDPAEDDGESREDGGVPEPLVGGGPGSLAQAKEALAAIAEYYNRWEPSSPALPLVRQAHLLIGKSFFDVMSILVPTQMDKAAFQIGAEQFFELPVAKLSQLSELTALSGGEQLTSSNVYNFRIQSRSQAISLLEQVQQFFRRSEPSSPVPMLCERARALAERDFMSVLREVLPKAAFKNFGADK